MKTFLRSLIVVGLVACVFQMAPVAYAACFNSIPLQDFFGAFLKGVNEGAVSTRAFVMGHPEINSGVRGGVVPAGSAACTVRNAPA